MGAWAAHTAAEASRPASSASGAPHRRMTKHASWRHAARRSHAASGATPKCVAAAVLHGHSRAKRIARAARGGSYLPWRAWRSSTPDMTPCTLAEGSARRPASRTTLCSPQAERAAPDPTRSAIGPGCRRCEVTAPPRPVSARPPLAAARGVAAAGAHGVRAPQRRCRAGAPVTALAPAAGSQSVAAARVRHAARRPRRHNSAPR